jgi:hypothetical protein
VGDLGAGVRTQIGISGNRYGRPVSFGDFTQQRQQSCDIVPGQPLMHTGPSRRHHKRRLFQRLQMR